MEPRRSVLDSELESMAREAASGQTATASLPFEQLSGRFSAPAAPAASDKVTVKLVVDPGAADLVGRASEDQGGTVTSHGESVLVADVGVDALRRLGSVKGLRRAEASRLLHHRLDDARGPITGLDEALQVHQLTGRGVVVGVIDSGVDYTHDDFRNDDGTTRLAWFGHARRLANSSQSVFDEFDEADINGALQGSQTLPQGDPNGHGTHCASIAAGNGRASQGRFRGGASQATIMAARCDELTDSHVIWAIRRMFELAGDRPCVINCSFGGHWGPHDGTSAIENVIARAAGPGRIIVVAAGNEAEDQIHWQGQLQVGQDLVIPVRIGDEQGQFVDVWVPRGDELDIEIEDPSGARFPADGNVHNGLFGLVVGDWMLDPVNRDQNLNVRVGNSPIGSIWRIRLTPSRVIQGRVHAWAGTSDPRTARNLFPMVTSPEYSIGMPATEERAISVASFVSRANITRSGTAIPTPGLAVGGLSPFSSHGPNRLGAQLPDVAAPGQYITAALASNSDFETDSNLVLRHDPTGRYITIQGTSMATPFVVSVIALMLEREPHLDPTEVRQRLRITAQRDDLTGAVWNPGFGFGRIDVQAILDYGVPMV
ncbi:MAG: S8 family serine peptidase [Geminicoccaceae bacterium]